MSDARFSAEAITAYHTEKYDNYDILDDGSIAREAPDGDLARLVDRGFMQIFRKVLWDEEPEPATSFPLETNDRQEISRIVRAFSDAQRGLVAARFDLSQAPAIDEVVNAYEDMYFMLAPVTAANRYLCELIGKAMGVLGLDSPLLPRRAYDGEALSAERLAAYDAAEFAHYSRTEAGLQPAAPALYSLLGMVHRNCNACARNFAVDDFDYAVQVDPITQGVTREQTQRISRRFINTQTVLETALEGRRPPPSKTWGEEAFADYHNMLQATTVENRYQRTLIEEAFDAMGLDDTRLDARSAAQFAEDARRIAAEMQSRQGKPL